MHPSVLDTCIAMLAGVSPVVAMPLAFALGYLAFGIPAHLRHGGVSRDVWGTVAGICMALVYAAFLAGVVPELHRPPLPVLVSMRAR